MDSKGHSYNGGPLMDLATLSIHTYDIVNQPISHKCSMQLHHEINLD